MIDNYEVLRKSLVLPSGDEEPERPWQNQNASELLPSLQQAQGRDEPSMPEFEILQQCQNDPDALAQAINDIRIQQNFHEEEHKNNAPVQRVALPQLGEEERKRDEQAEQDPEITHVPGQGARGLMPIQQQILSQYPLSKQEKKQRKSKDKLQQGIDLKKYITSPWTDNEISMLVQQVEIYGDDQWEFL